jgi:hypothetical protein
MEGTTNMALQISDISAILKKVIIPEVYDLIKTESILRANIKKNVGVRVANNTIYISARTGRHSGIYHVAEGTAPFTGKAKYQQPYTSMKYGFGTIELSDQSIEAALNSGDTKAIAAILSTEIMALKDDIKADDNRIMHGAGTGKLALTNGTGANSTTLLIDGNPAGLDANEYFAEGMYIQIGSTAANTALVSALVGTTGLTLSAGTTWANDDIIRKASYDEPMGLAGIIDDGDNVATIQAMTRASYPIFNAITYDTDTTLTESNMVSTYIKAKRKGKIDVCLMGAHMYALYGSLLTSTKRTRDTKEVLTGGWKGLDFMDGVGVYLDHDTWYGYVQMVNFAGLTIAEMTEPMKWLEGEAHGGVLIRSASNRTVWEGTLKHYWNLVGLNFQGQARMSSQD